MIVISMWLIQLIIEYKYSQAMVISYQNGEEYGDSGNGTLNQPAGIAIDQEGNVYVADTANNRIQVFSSNGTFISKWGGYGAGNGTLKSPTGIAIDPSSGNVYT